MVSPDTRGSVLSLRGCWRPQQSYCSPEQFVFTQRVVAFTFYLMATFILTYCLYQGGAGRLDHHVRVEQDRLQQGLGVGGQLRHQGCQSQVDPQAIVWKLADPKNNSES